jgi:hypothetical protein
VLAAWKPGRPGRSRSESIDPGSAGGRSVLPVTAAPAWFDLALSVGRTVAGHKVATERGVGPGRRVSHAQPGISGTGRGVGGVPGCR